MTIIVMEIAAVKETEIPEVNEDSVLLIDVGAEEEDTTTATTTKTVQVIDSSLISLSFQSY